MMDRRLITLGAKCELARRNFWWYCHLRSSDFYSENRDYLKQLCGLLQDFYENSDKQVLIVNMPPRHGKSRTLQCFVEWVLGKNNQMKIMTGSYNETLSTVFAKNVRNTISEAKADMYRIVYSDIFKNTKIKRGDAAMNLWSLEGGYNNYLATSPSGTATGFGCNLMIIDDIIKSAEEAYSEIAKEKMYDWFVNTMLSRLEEGGKIAIVMTRWASDDLAGRALEHFAENKVIHINMTAVQSDGTMLCDEVLSLESCEEKKRAMGLDIWSANYQQEPIDIKGRLYNQFKTYTSLPTFKQIRAYVDTADTGSDYLASYVYGVTMDNEAYILDVLYTKEPMEITEPKTAEMFLRNQVNMAYIESNNGGRGFARSVERILREKHRSNRTSIKWFSQRKNKVARILSNATWCMEHIYFPENWRDKWSELHDHLMKYQKEGKNLHDDAEDALTGIAEDLSAGITLQPTRVNY